jgi:beta-lactamase regulating signal transducer with metallopeptidase domain
MASTASTASSAVTTAMAEDHSLQGWAIAVIVIAVCIFVALLAVGAFFLVRKIRERRKNHGEYRPQYEEYQHAKDLPYLPPPAIEGLI